ncbi:MAG: hypothetical protein Q4C77_03070 [Eubacteriales bacterium]|nr:hypothetical protein [Eubacteriales bacterium]
MRYEDCEKCRYCQKWWNRDKYGNFTTGYYGCNFLPHWGKPIETIDVCPKVLTGRDKSSLRDVCRVNKN